MERVRPVHDGEGTGITHEDERKEREGVVVGHLGLS
jgi:hypothetical protein